MVTGKVSALARRGIQAFQGIPFSKDLLKTIGKGLRICPEDTPCKTDRGTRGSLPYDPFINPEVTLHSTRDNRDW